MHHDRSTGMVHWLKGEGFRISPHFHSKEFECHCSYPECRDQKTDSNLIGILEYLRSKTDQPMLITSAYRCKQYQNDLRGQGVNTVAAGRTSQHELGKAVDIALDNRYIKDEANSVFEAMGIASNFIHVDMRVDKRRRWGY